jgi:hypothetical protein
MLRPVNGHGVWSSSQLADYGAGRSCCYRMTTSSLAVLRPAGATWITNDFGQPRNRFRKPRVFVVDTTGFWVAFS